MQRTLTALLLFLFTLPAWAQAPIPGTFTRMQPRRDIDLYSVPVITTPQISFGSALTPPVVSLRQEIVVSTPTGAYDPSLLTRVPEPEETSTSEESEQVYGPHQRVRPVRMARFDYVVAPEEGLNPGESEAESLGTAADSMRKGPPPAQHTYTNQDIDRLNQSAPGSFTSPAAKPQQEQTQPPSNVQPQNEQVRPSQRSPFVTQLTANLDD
jgi:hypothetical protein